MEGPGVSSPGTGASPIAESSYLHYHHFVREKVLRYIRERRLLCAGDRVCVAVSGGADSVALLRALLDLRSEVGIVLSVAHFHHGLRGEASDADEAFVAELAKQHDLEFFSGRGNVHDHGRTAKLSVEAAARELRYEWFGWLITQNKLNAIATGHTLDDQAETVLLKFLRGAGTRGLAGIYPSLECSREVVSGAKAPNHPTELYRTPNGVPLQIRVIRPLLGLTREEVEQYLAALGQAWREDESNLDHRFTRNRVRHELLPLLQREYNPNIRQVLSDAAELARAEEEYWQALVQLHLRARQTEVPQGLKPGNSIADDGTAKAVPLQTRRPAPFPVVSASEAAEETERSGTADLQVRVQASDVCHPEPALAGEGSAFVRLNLDNFAGLPLALQRRLLKRLLESRQIAADFEHVEKLRRCALGGSPKAELPGGWMASRIGEHLELHPPRPTPCAADYAYSLPVPGEVRIPELGLTVRCLPVPHDFAKEEPPGSLLNAKLLGRELVVRNWQPGDRFWPAQSKSEEKLKRLFSERHVPAGERSSWPVVLHGVQIAWVSGFPVARAFAWNGSGDALKIELLG